MRLDRFATLYLARPLRALAPLSDTGSVRILMYHRICEDPEPSASPYYRLNTSPARFSQQMQFLADHGWSVVCLENAAERLKIRSASDKSVVITFDDGYRDFATHAAPILARHGFAASVFLPTAFIGEEPLSYGKVPCMTWSEVRSLRAAGFHFGSHTVTHPKLREISHARLRSELIDSKKTIEDHLGESVTTFAHPYAFPDQDRSYVARFSTEVEAAGYGCAVTTRLGAPTSKDSLFALKRLPVNDCDDLALFQAKLEGSYNWLAVPQRIAKHLKSNRCKASAFKTSTVPSVTSASLW